MTYLDDNQVIHVGCWILKIQYQAIIIIIG
jgi:hypothetical protein